MTKKICLYCRHVVFDCFSYWYHIASARTKIDTPLLLFADKPEVCPPFDELTFGAIDALQQWHNPDRPTGVI